MTDALGDRMKRYESIECGRTLIPRLPIIARIDGRAFHAFTKGMQRPFDKRFNQCMVNTTMALIAETNACIGYTQSDEITLAWKYDTHKSEVWFGGRIHKMVSQLAAHATLEFNQQVAQLLPDFSSRQPTFDARVWNVPDVAEGTNVFVWREWDATKNSISMAASHYFSHKQLLGKNSKDKIEMLHVMGIDWNKYPSEFKRGVYVRKNRYPLTLSYSGDIESLPEKHHARMSGFVDIERTAIEVLNMPPITKVINRESVIFDTAYPMAELGAGTE